MYSLTTSDIRSFLAEREKALESFQRDRNRAGPGWVPQPFDFTPFLRHYGLKLQPGFQWIVLLNEDSSLLFALPEGEHLVLEPPPGIQTLKDCGPYDIPVSTNAMSNFMQAITGPDTTLAYVAASLLARDGQEIGALQHGADWSYHKVYLETPFLSPGELRELVGLLLKYLETTPIDIVYLLRDLFPRGQVVFETYHKDLASGKFKPIGWNQETLQLCISRLRYDRRIADGVLAGLPFELAQLRSLCWRGYEDWQIFEPIPTEWLTVEEGPELVSVTFYSETDVDPPRLVRRVAHFQRGNFHPRLEDHIVAKGEGGVTC